MNRFSGVKNRNCRSLLATSRIRREKMADCLNEKWCELRKHATIEPDSKKLAKLIADWRNGKR
jgi:hypothetical protein